MVNNSVIIELDGLHFHYDPAKPVLAGVDFRLDRGERIGLIGSNGSGKTTLLHLIVGLLKPVKGSIRAFGKVRGSEADFLDVRRRVGLVFQDPDDQLFSPTVLEDVAFGPLNLGKKPDEAIEIAAETLESVGLEGFENRITYKLSGGEKKLVALATALAMRPEALLLDEPVNGLDGESRERIESVLRGLDTAMVIVSHDEDIIRALATRIMRIQNGVLHPEMPGLTG